MKKIVIIFILTTISTYSQDFSVGLNYSGLISGKNYSSSTVYSFEGDCKIMNNFLTIGITASIIDARIKSSFIKNSPPVDPSEVSYKLGIQLKCYPLEYVNNLSNVKPYIGIEFGDYISNYISTYLNMPNSCDVKYRIELPNTIYSNINFGTDIFLSKTLGLNIGFRYQIFNPTINYEKPICSNDIVVDYTKFTEKVNLNMLLWTIGFRINL